MTASQIFVDYYGILQVSPNCDAKLLESAYHHLAKRYHPDHTTTSDVAKFGQVVEAYGVLRDPEKRAEYDLLHAQHCDGEYLNFPSTGEDGIEETSALDDADDHARILCTYTVGEGRMPRTPASWDFIFRTCCNARMSISSFTNGT